MRYYVRSATAGDAPALTIIGTDLRNPGQLPDFEGESHGPKANKKVLSTTVNQRPGFHGFPVVIPDAAVLCMRQCRGQPSLREHCPQGAKGLWRLS